MSEASLIIAPGRKPGVVYAHAIPVTPQDCIVQDPSIERPPRIRAVDPWLTTTRDRRGNKRPTLIARFYRVTHRDGSETVYDGYRAAFEGASR